MTKRPSASVPHPHDAYFKAVFKMRALALQFIQFALPSAVLERLNLDSLELAPESFIDPKLQESLSDLVYVCQYKTGATLRICLLFEHKGYRPGREFHFQVLQYILRAGEEDIR